ncbi:MULTISPECIES: hypothetical protein [unclassified Pseudomonas]|uniref:hypothetical protein n=1 Tax=unclassified Pseudomonas TaxID=196821 RepID=UPI001AE373BF|nr:MULTISPECIES: hypothetical protein [unclassified Pseudomonas]HDS1695760.1 hypothetical protein [Pseudomonas putida]MBP2270815.1 hypothetical protein [Pseudomonas sp. BP6]MBP2284902.1 hypothetical protein [Pseudomonas sp. BP7]MBP2290200.1 hypothetical protein [Pseudomonas sp. BP7]HDS1700982.1 hypothetical protein [Pseudomonas putida]
MDTNKMMPEAMKSEFEAAFLQVFGFGAAEAIAAKDDTAMAIMGAAAWAWQASREAVVVELPKPHYEFEGDPAPEMFASQVVAAIEAQGLKVAQ